MTTIKLKRIRQELIELKRIGIESNALIKFDLQKSSLDKEKDDDAFGQSEDFTIIGRVFPNSDIYGTVSLQIEIKLESTFPFIPPRVRMFTQIYHPNIDRHGEFIHTVALRMTLNIFSICRYHLHWYSGWRGRLVSSDYTSYRYSRYY